MQHLIDRNAARDGDRSTAFRLVGICQGNAAAKLVNREKFYMPPPPPTPTAPLSLVVESPGVAKGSTEYHAVLYSSPVTTLQDRRAWRA